MSDQSLYTYQTRFTYDNPTETLLDAFGILFGQVERSLFAQISAGTHPHKLKSSFLKRFAITARQYNSVRMQLQGRIASVKERRPQLIQESQERIDSLKKTIKKSETKNEKALVHQKKRRLDRLENKLNLIKQDEAKGTIRLCFGSKKLFREQFALKENGFNALAEWKCAWQAERSSDFFLVGSKDETAGNQSCQAILEKDDSLTLKLRLPNCLIDQYGKHVYLKGIKFKYGHPILLAALQKGYAISYRFKKDRKGWRVFASTVREDSKPITKEETGAIGIDLNADHVALEEIDRFGNPLVKKTFSLNTYGKTHNQSLALIGDVCAAIVDYAQASVSMQCIDF